MKVIFSSLRESGMTAEGWYWGELRCLSSLLVLKLEFQLYKKWSAASLMATRFLFGTHPPGSCNFTLREEKMPMSKTSLDHIIVSLPKRHKENRKIVNVRTEVAGGLSKLCYIKEILYQLGQRQTIGLEVFCFCKRPRYGAKQMHWFWENKVSFWNSQHI